MSGPWGAYLNRSLQVAREGTSKVLGMRGMLQSTAPKSLFTFRSQEDIKQYVTGCDADIGGRSTCTIDLGPDGKGRFWGDMRLEVPRGKEGRMRSGYAGFRNRVRTTLFGSITEDLSLHRYLALRVRAAGDPKTRTAYFVNLQTEGPIVSDLWQHRLYLREENTWEDVVIPFESFILTNSGEAASDQITMNRSRVRSVGISILGGNAKVAGSYELGIDFIGAINDPVEIDAFTAQDPGTTPTPEMPTSN